MADTRREFEVYPFKLRDARTGRWRVTRYKASLEEIEKLGGEVCGDPERRPKADDRTGFHPYPAAKPPRPDRIEWHPHEEVPPAIDATECLLACVFLRRLATWHVRHRRFAQAQGAAALHRQLAL